MREKLRKRLTYANVVATLALFLALCGGVVYAAGKITGKDIKKNAISGKLVKNESLSGADIKELTGADIAELTGADIAEASLSGVNAATVAGKTVGCPAGTRLYAGECWEEQSKPGTTWSAAALECGARGGELPDATALYAFSQEPGITLGGDEWTAELSSDPAVNTNLDAIKVNDAGLIRFAALTEAHNHRCVLSPIR
jgi:hypothetical protein